MKKLKLSGVALASSLALIGCGGGGIDSTATETGYFIDSAVEGLSFKTETGTTGTTDAFGRFQFSAGETVAFYIGNLNLGEALPDAEGLMTPALLAHGNEALKLLLLQTLQALDTDGEPSNGITLPENLLEEIDSVSIEDLDEAALLALDDTLANHLDKNFDGHIDVNAGQAEAHFDHSLDTWGNGHRPDDNATEGGNGNGHGNNGGNGNGNGTPIDIIGMPTSTLTQDLKDAIAYMGNEERLAYDVYMNLYEYHINNGTQINQLQNIASRSEKTHVGIVQSLVQKYDLGSDDLTNVTAGVADNTIAFEDMPRGQYDISAIQDLYDALYVLGQGSTEAALKVGCMVEVTDINDLDDYIELAETSNATDVKEAFNVLRDGSYNHYWAFDKGLKNLGITNGCYIEGDALLGENKENIYPQNANESGNDGGRGGR